ncbi:S1 RNA-binding domain-containing protein [Streptomyces sp. NBC_00162]|uniref:S1 RNA-binding domain-containing protein n=1 Tax=Streptomyces sp. NBC_00162 TaxID=2903629 RepID=UPI00214BF80C|nr:S1 RNA-binding domain-containing protein [Streptomyces sp. NBC_00162]UUU44908.1 S1 RNA-binding domain-containing protein [Streptomyces sp. NBC_00162]
MDLEPGQVCRGVISGVDDFCLTVTLEGGVHGRVSAANLSWKRVDHPSQVASVGEEVTVVFMSFDPDRNDISLSIKDLTVDPFIEFARTQLGETCLGRVAKITPIGFFVRLPSGIEGLLPGSSPVDVGVGHAEIGDEVAVRVDYINLQRRQVRVSLVNGANEEQQAHPS